MTSHKLTLSDVPVEQAVGLLLAVDPVGLVGVRLRGMPGIERDRWLSWLEQLLPPQTIWRKVPANVDLDRLLGGLDVAATMKHGAPRFSRGLLECADGGVIVLPMAERLAGAVAAIIALAIDRHEITIERDGFTRCSRSVFSVIAFDEGLEGEALDPALADRLAFSFSPTDAETADYDANFAAAVSRARELLSATWAGDGVLEAIAGTAIAVGAPSMRAEYLTLCAARAAAALAGRAEVTIDDVAVAAQLVLAPRATRLPAPPQEAETPADAEKESGEDDPSTSSANEQTIDEVVLDAVRAAVPSGLLAALANQGKTRASEAGRFGPTVSTAQRGRPIGVRSAEALGGQRLHVLETLKAAAPWQRIRDSEAGDGQRRLRLEKRDLRAVRFKQHAGTTTVFVVDASGSQAARRLREVKGAIELLLAECYVRRDEVALVAFRGEHAELVLPPTRALARARRLLAGLPGGGATPLAAGIDTARALVASIRRRGRTASVVLLTDGRANVSRDGAVGHTAASEDALKAARAFRALDVPTVLVDTSARPRPAARELAQTMAARYEALPHADANGISAAVQTERAA